MRISPRVLQCLNLPLGVPRGFFYLLCGDWAGGCAALGELEASAWLHGATILAVKGANPAGKKHPWICSQKCFLHLVK